VVIPKALRDRAQLQPGDAVDFELRNQEIVLVRATLCRQPRRPVREG